MRERGEPAEPLPGGAVGEGRPPADRRAAAASSSRSSSWREQLHRARPDAAALVAEAGVGDPPAVVDLADHPVGGDAHVVEEDLVEVVGPGDLAQRAHVDPGGPHVERERGDARLLGHVGVGAGQQVADVGVVAVGGPHLLAVDDVVVAVAATARVFRLARSLPAPGSLNSWHHRSSPERIRGR